MKFIIIAIMAVSGGVLCQAQPNTTFSSPCDQLDCQLARYQYSFCDQDGHLINKCSADPNNEPGLTPLKKATPLHFCLSIPPNPRYPAVFIHDTSNPYDVADTLFNIYETPNLLAQAEARWTLLCPPQGPNNDYQYCCVSVQWSNSPENFARSPGGVQFTRALTSQKLDFGSSCGIVCNESYIVINQEDQFTRLNENGAPKIFFFTNPRGLSRLLPDYHYVSFYSIMLHELGHWLGMGHADEPDSYGNSCPYLPGSIMVNGRYDNWDSRIVDLSSSDVCMFKKLYCCDQTKNHARYGAGVEDEQEPAPEVILDAVPNPTTDRISLRLSKAIGPRSGTIRMVDATGAVVLQQELSPASTVYSIDVSRLHSGAYMLEVTTRTSTSGRKVIIVR